jgi:hypothetical protein
VPQLGDADAEPTSTPVEAQAANCIGVGVGVDQNAERSWPAGQSRSSRLIVVALPCGGKRVEVECIGCRVCSVNPLVFYGDYIARKVNSTYQQLI